MGETVLIYLPGDAVGLILVVSMIYRVFVLRTKMNKYLEGQTCLTSIRDRPGILQLEVVWMCRVSVPSCWAFAVCSSTRSITALPAC